MSLLDDIISAQAALDRFPPVALGVVLHPADYAAFRRAAQALPPDLASLAFGKLPVIVSPKLPRGQHKTAYSREAWAKLREEYA